MDVRAASPPLTGGSNTRRTPSPLVPSPVAIAPHTGRASPLVTPREFGGLQPLPQPLLEVVQHRISVHSQDHTAPGEKEKAELKSRVAELEEFQDKYEHEKKENQILQNRLQDLMTGQTDATRNLMRTSEALDRLHLDHKKKVEQLEKMQVDVKFKEDRIRNLEIRASEVEKAELILESTKQNLEYALNQVKVRDDEIKRLNKDVDDCNRQIDVLKKTIEDMHEKMEDMKIQVRHEIMKNENIEKNLETIPRLKDTIQEQQDEIAELKKHIEEKNALLAGARKTVREYKDKIRVTEYDITKAKTLKEDLEHSRYEVESLKMLMYGKDYLVSQKTKALDLSKEIISVLNDSLDPDQVQRVQQLLGRFSGADTPRTYISRSTAVSTPTDAEFRSGSAPPGKYRSITPAPGHTRDINVNHRPYTTETEGVVNGSHSNHHGNHRTFQQVSDSESVANKHKRPVSAFAPSSKKTAIVHRTSSYREAHKVYTQPLPRKPFDYDRVESPRNNHTQNSKHSSAKNRPPVEIIKISVEDAANTSDKSSPSDATDGPHSRLNSAATDMDSVSSSGSDIEEDLSLESEDVLRSLTAMEKDEVLAEIVNVGDRVLISCPQKPPRYGKKRVLKPINYTGIVKFLGKLSPEKHDARVHVGVRMDEPVGDTDGMYKGKRLMYTPADQGKFYKLRDITSVLNFKTGRYIPLKRLIVHHVHKQIKADLKPEH
ncbi:neurofilament light polypeptide-like isoform X3 [Dreissena polymorpha]|uniref:neurofilament light polypeptide-like isoform X3 n=1 Tax=Dreissena polymorpha TaxID=45954 RepID=UPI0022650D13|nr:neurofilament light polypeptide-like isoform X3 [Dreissena polymorpha]